MARREALNFVHWPVLHPVIFSHLSSLGMAKDYMFRPCQ